MKKKMVKNIGILLAVVLWVSALLGNSAFASELSIADHDLQAEDNVGTELSEDTQCQYIYEESDYGYNVVIGFNYNGDLYKFIYDERDIISTIVDAAGNLVAYYECSDEGVISNIYSWDGNDWQINTDSDFIGNINKMRWLGCLYDEESCCYLIYDRYYDPFSAKYTDGVDNSFAYAETNPFLSKYQDDEIMLLDSYASDLAALEWAEALMKDNSHGTFISYSSGWYESLSTVEILSRCIYAEGGTAYTTEGNAVAWVILNRVNNSDFPGTPRAVITDPDQLEAITGSIDRTIYAREQVNTGSDRWENATYLACLMLTTTSTSEWKTIVGNPINGQLYFFSYTYAKKHNTFTGTSSNSLYYGSKKIKNVYVLGYGTVTSFTTLFNNYNPTDSSRNIYYDTY